MLGKLLKHEFKATGRMMLPFLGALLALSVVAWLSLNVFFFNGSGLLSVIGGIVITLYFVMLAAIAVSYTHLGVEVRVEIQKLLRVHPHRQGHAVGQIADQLLCLDAGRPAADFNLAAAGLQEPAGYLYERGLAGAVRAQQAEYCLLYTSRCV